MKGKAYVLNLLLCALWGALLAIFLVCRALFPAVILPAVDIPMLLGVCLAALLLEQWLGLTGQRPWWEMLALAALTFGLLPLCAGLADGAMAAKLAVFGGLTFAVTTVLFDSMDSRFSDQEKSRGALVVGAFVLFLAGQCLTNLFF